MRRLLEWIPGRVERGKPESPCSETGDETLATSNGREETVDIAVPRLRIATRPEFDVSNIGQRLFDPVVFRAIQSFAGLAPVVPRMVGSAAVSLAAVALGGGCFAGTGLEIWDAAAGMLLAEERGRAVRWWRFAGHSSHHVLAGEPELVHAFEPVMPDFIEAWRGQRNVSAPGSVADELLGPSATMVVQHENE